MLKYKEWKIIDKNKKKRNTEKLKKNRRILKLTGIQARISFGRPGVRYMCLGSVIRLLMTFAFIEKVFADEKCKKGTLNQ